MKKSEKAKKDLAKRILFHKNRYKKSEIRIKENKRFPIDFKNQLILEQKFLLKQNLKLERYLSNNSYKLKDRHLLPIGIEETKFGVQKVYRTAKNYDVFLIDNDVKKILNEPIKNGLKVKGVTVVFRVLDAETDLIKFGGDFITKELFERFQSEDKSIFEHISNKLRFSKSMEDFEILNIDLRVIYEKINTSKNKI
jgi:hypothetical protein